jgi:hypothetical protein
MPVLRPDVKQLIRNAVTCLVAVALIWWGGTWLAGYWEGEAKTETRSAPSTPISTRAAVSHPPSGYMSQTIPPHSEGEWVVRGGCKYWWVDGPGRYRLEVKVDGGQTVTIAKDENVNGMNPREGRVLNESDSPVTVEWFCSN